MIPQHVIARFATTQAMPMDKAASLFFELEEFLARAAYATQIPTKKVLDEAWHTFILHTRDYAEYCSNRFGRFVHHIPTIQSTAVDSDCSSNCKSCKS